LFPLPQSYALVTARIPIIKLTDPVTGISADLSVQNDMPVYRSKLLHEYTRIDDRLLSYPQKHTPASIHVSVVHLSG
jgi:hypothetical protein